MRSSGVGWRGVWCILLVGFSMGVRGQEKPKTITIEVKKATTGDQDFSGESVVIVRSDSVYQQNADGTGMRMQTMVARVQSEAALRQVGVLTVSYAANSEKVEWVYVRVRHPDGTVVNSAVADAMEISPQVTQQAPFYSDLKEKQLPVRSLKVGDTLEWQAKVTRTKPEAPGQFWGSETFSQDVVVLAESVELHVPRDKYVKVWSPLHTAVESEDGTDHVWRWESSQLKPTVGAAADAAKELKKKKVLTPDEELEEKEGKLPDVAWTTFKSWDDVGAWYRALQATRIVPDADVKAKAAELTNGKTTDEARVRAVYSYVATQVRYIGVAFGVGRYQPHEASEVLQNQYGDCKDKHALLAAMLTTLGMHPDAVLVGAGIRFNQAVPSPAAFNHLITRVTVDGKPVWLDTTSEVAPYRVLLPQVRDHEVLVVPETGTAQVDRTPADLPFAAFQKMEANGSIDKDGLSNSRIVFTVRGDDEVIIRSVLRQLQPGQWDLLAQKLSEGIGYSGTVSHSEFSRPDATDEPLTISYDYKRDHSGDWTTHQIVPQVSPIIFPVVDEKEPPIKSLHLGSRRTETSTSAMKIPDGWTAELPEAIHAKSAYATVDQTYRFEKGVVYSERRLEVLKEKVPVSEWKAYKKFWDDAGLGGEQFIDLIKPGSGSNELSKGSNAVSAMLGSSPGTAAAKLLEKAMASLQAFDTKSARELLDKAKAMNPQQRGLWLGYGMVEAALGAGDAAIADYNKELAAHPDSFEAYRFIMELQLQREQKKEAEATLRKWEAVDTQNPDPAKILAQVLLDEGDAAGAATEAQTALWKTTENKGDDESLELLLGRALLRNGMTEHGRKTLVDLLEGTSDVDIANKASYYLADAGLELPLAEKHTRSGLESMEAESQAWTLDERLETLRAKTQLIEATWDTLGWILFREGKVDDGESYVKASWHNRQTLAVGEHLGDIELAKSDKAAAIKSYQLAVATRGWKEHINGDSNKMEREPLNPDGIDVKRVLAKIAALTSARTPWNDVDAELVQMRKLDLGPAQGLNGVAEYRLLISADGVVRTEGADDKKLAGGTLRLTDLKVDGWVPQASKAQLVKLAMLNCHSGRCEVVMEP